MYTRPTAPRSIGGVIDDAIRLYSASMRAWLLPSVVGSALTASIGVWLTLRLGARPTFIQMTSGAGGPLVTGTYLIFSAISIWTNFAVLGPIVRVFKGENPTNAETMAAAVRALPGAILGSILFGFGVVVGLVLLIIPGFWLAGRWMYWGVPFIDERCSAPDALSRSYHLSAGNWWRGTTIVTVALIIVIVLTLVVSFVLGIITVIGGSDLLVRSILTQSLGSVLGIFLTPALPAAFVAGYFDLQLRREGDDLAARVGKLTSN